MTDLIALHTTVASTDDAQRIAEAALQNGLAACVQMHLIESRYVWKGALVHETELDLRFKTIAARYDALAALIRKLHPYELPAIYAVPVVQAEADYAAWVAREAAGLPRALVTPSPGGEGTGGGMTGA